MSSALEHKTECVTLLTFNLTHDLTKRTSHLPHLRIPTKTNHHSLEIKKTKVSTVGKVARLFQRTVVKGTNITVRWQNTV